MWNPPWRNRSLGDLPTFSRKVGDLSISIERDPQGSEEYYNLRATDAKGETVGEMTAIAIPGVDVAVGGITSKAGRGARVGTRMYEAMAEYACQKDGVPMASDFSRSRQAEGFWRKQFDKGRAKHYCYAKDTADTDMLDPSKGVECPPDDRVYFSTETYAQFSSRIKDSGLVSRYKLTSCPAPKNLEGVPRRARGKRGKR